MQAGLRPGDARAAAAAHAARARRDLGGRRHLRAQPPRAHRGERVLGRRVRARLRRRATRSCSSRTPAAAARSARTRRSPCAASRAGRCRSPSSASCSDADGSIIAVTGGNDLTARDIEAENPLYLPQAKLFAACCALGPAVLVPDDPAAPVRDLGAHLERRGRPRQRGRDEHRRDAPQLRGAGLLVRTRESRARRLGAAHGHGRRAARRRRAGARATASRSRSRASACSRTPCAPPDATSSGQTPSVAALRQHRDRLDLDLHARHRQLLHADERARRARVAEERLAQRVDQRAVVDVREVDVDLDDVLAACSRRPRGWRRGSSAPARTARPCRRRRRARRARRSRGSPRRTAGRWPRRRRSSG